MKKYCNFPAQQQEFLDNVWPMQRMHMAELVSDDGNSYKYKGVTMPATDSFAQRYDDLVGINKDQRSLVTGASGEKGMSKFRNYLSTANHGSGKRDEVFVLADPSSHVLANIIPACECFVTPRLFFEFANLLAEKTGYQLERMESQNKESPLIRMYYLPSNPYVFDASNSDSLITDGYVLSWEMGKVSLGQYSVRLQCSNGMTVQKRVNGLCFKTLSSDELQEAIRMIKERAIFAAGTDSLIQMVTRARESRISLREMSQMKKLLFGLGISEEQSESLIPYQRCIDDYKTAGIGIKSTEFTKGPGTIWEYYNVLTDFASHSEAMNPDDIRRGMLLDGAFRFISKTPDIIETQYIDIY